MELYRLVYADSQVQKNFVKALEKAPRADKELILKKLEALEANPKPQQFKILAQPVFIHGYWAPYRLRIGSYRVLYDIDDSQKKVIILALRRRTKKTYK